MCIEGKLCKSPMSCVCDTLAISAPRLHFYVYAPPRDFTFTTLVSFQHVYADCKPKQALSTKFFVGLINDRGTLGKRVASPADHQDQEALVIAGKQQQTVPRMKTQVVSMQVRKHASTQVQHKSTSKRFPE